MSKFGACPMCNSAAALYPCNIPGLDGLVDICTDCELEINNEYLSNHTCCHCGGIVDLEKNIKCDCLIAEQAICCANGGAV